MPEKTTSDLFNTALAELEQIIKQLEPDADEFKSSLTKLEPDDITNPRSCEPALPTTEWFPQKSTSQDAK